MNYLLSDGTFTDSLSKSQMDFIKMNLKFSKGTVFNHQEYGYEHFNIDDDKSIKDTIERIVSSMENCNIRVSQIDRSVQGTVIIRFEGSEEELTL